MESLPLEYKKYGYTHKQVDRHGDVAIYSQFGDNKDIPLVYIVFLIFKQEASNIYGRDYPAKEIVPGNSYWGQYAFTCYTLERARIRADELKKRDKSNVINVTANNANAIETDPFGALEF